MEKFFLGCVIMVLASCTHINNHHLFDRIADQNATQGMIEMRTDGYYWKFDEDTRSGKTWKGLTTILFLPGGYYLGKFFTPAVPWAQRECAQDSLNTFARARTNLLDLLPYKLDMGRKRQLDRWGRYHADSDSIAFVAIVDVGVVFPIMMRTYLVNYHSGVFSPDSGFNLGDGWYQFEKLPQRFDSAGLKINTPKFKKKKFPGFYLGW